MFIRKPRRAPGHCKYTVDSDAFHFRVCMIRLTGVWTFNLQASNDTLALRVLSISWPASLNWKHYLPDSTRLDHQALLLPFSPNPLSSRILFRQSLPSYF